MRFGVGLPNAVAGVTRGRLLERAVRAEELGASTVACVDRLVYPSWETMTTLAAAAAVTERVGLLAGVLVAPLRTNTPLLAKQAATVDVLSEGRLTLGLGVGRRPDDYELSGADFRRRGAVLDAQLDTLGQVWRESGAGTPGAVGPAPYDRARGPRVLIGGQSEATLRRLEKHGEGWIAAAGLGGWTGALAFAERVRETWEKAGRPGHPRMVATVYAAGGPDPRSRARECIRHYYSFLGTAEADELAGHVLTDHAGLMKARDELVAAGFDEMILLPTSDEPDDLDPLQYLVENEG
ncbi:LLM class flavin-dependent oxidoreductase [Streptomyces sp. NPDC026672]|uniref:LLM class flavin-dependent oxidoreductase n=1 Tax=unclassified Streptomyces TaxID=2593676 RepID=UPI0033F13DCB